MSLLVDCSFFKLKKFDKVFISSSLKEFSANSLYEISTQNYNQAREFLKRIKINHILNILFLSLVEVSPVKLLQSISLNKGL